MNAVRGGSNHHAHARRIQPSRDGKTDSFSASRAGNHGRLLVQGQIHGNVRGRHHTSFKKDCDSPGWVRVPSDCEAPRHAQWTVAELASPARGFLVADASGVYGFFVA